MHPYVLITANCTRLTVFSTLRGRRQQKITGSLPISFTLYLRASKHQLVRSCRQGRITEDHDGWSEAGPTHLLGALPSVLSGLLPTPNSQLALPNINSLLKGTSSLSTW